MCVMKKVYLCFVISLASLFVISCNKDVLGSLKEVTEGIPTRFSLNLELPKTSSVSVATKSIYDYESEIDELALIMFEANGRKMVIDLTGKITASNSVTATGNTRTYNLVGDITTDADGKPVLSGTYTVYAVANWSSPFCRLTLDGIKAMSQAELKVAFANNTTGVLNVSGNQKLPMSSITPNVVIAPESEQPGGSSIEIRLKRVISHIEFEFVNGGTVLGAKPEIVEENPRFIPNTFIVYNVPEKAYLFNQGTSNIANKITWQKPTVGQNKASVRSDISGQNIIEFFMLENVQDVNTNVTTYGDRDKWTNSQQQGAVLAENKVFANAPEGSTFIAVEGRYTGKSYTGNVAYTIHLGNFTNSVDAYGNNASMGNFTVNRNEHHKYKITINGVNSMVTEATVESGQTGGGAMPGVEGVIGSTIGSQFVLDAHYETVLLKFPLDKGKLKNAKIIFMTPYSPDASPMGPDELDATPFGPNNLTNPSMDYGWVKFMKPNNDLTVFPKYNNTKVCDAKVFLKELIQLGNDNTAPLNPHYIIKEESVNGQMQSFVYAVAFVDEFYYDGKPWNEFVNVSNRIIAVSSSPLISHDRNTIVFKDYFFQLEQRSIKTVYNVNKPELNAFGIETWNETGKSANGSGGDANGAYAWAKSFNLMGEGTQWPDVTKAGYNKTITDNSKTAHRFEGVSIDANHACLTRNRDENGNGRIDREEVKWYLPSMRQYFSLWMGIDFLKGDTQLFDPKDKALINNETLSTYNHFTCSPDRYRIYWAVEGASAGSYESFNKNAEVRCVRNLKTYNGEAAFTYSDNPSTRIISVTEASPSALRNQVMTGEYTGGHDHLSVDNRVYPRFQVARALLGQTYIAPQPAKTEIVPKSWSYTSRYYTTQEWWGNQSHYGVKVTFAPAKMQRDKFDYMYWNAEWIDVPQNGECPEIDTGSEAGYVALLVRSRSTGATQEFCAMYDPKGTGNTFYKRNGGNPDKNSPLTGDIELNFAGTDVEIEGTATKHTINELKTLQNLCASNYSELPDKSDLGKWRVPNQRELMLMSDNAASYLPNASEANTYGCCTFFFNTTMKHQPFAFFGNITLDAGSGDNKTYIIRCVRDADISSSAAVDASSYTHELQPIF